MSKVIPPVVLSKQDETYLLSLTSDDIGQELLQDLIANKSKIVDGKFVKVPPRFNTYDKFTLPKGKLFSNDKDATVTVGVYLFLLMMINEECSKVMNALDYIDGEAIDSGKIEGMIGKMESGALTKKITTVCYIEFMNKLQWYYGVANFLSGSMSARTAAPLQSITKEKAKLFKDNKEALAKGDTVLAAKIEKDLLNKAKEELKGDKGMDLYNSGSNASFGNNYKAMFVMKGPIKDNMTGKYDIVKSNFADGIEKDELKPHFDSLVYGAYSKGVGTQVAGYLSKKFIAAYQSVVMDKKGSDCGTKASIDLVLTKWISGLFLYCYIKDGKNTILLTPENISSYVGRSINMRLPMHCTGDKICNRCGGELPYMRDDMQIGISTFVASGSLLRKSMKKFHDTSIKLTKLDVDDLIL